MPPLGIDTAWIRLETLQWARVQARAKPNTLQEKQVLPSAYSFAVSFLSGMTTKAHMPSAMGKANGKALADGVELICRQPFLSRQLTDGKQHNS